MRYTNWAAVVARYPSVARISQAEATAVESAFIIGAEAEIDARFASRYVVPFANTPTLAPAIIADIATDLAYYRITLLKLEAAQSKVLKDSIDSRITEIANGNMSIVGSGGLVVGESGTVNAWSTHKGYPNITGIDDVSDWVVSSGELVDQESRRGY